MVKLAGELRRAEVPDLLQACSGIARQQLIINLADLVSADFAGLDALRRLRREGAALVAVAEYIRMKLDTQAS